VLSGEATNTNLIVFGLIRLGIYLTLAKHANHYIMMPFLCDTICFLVFNAIFSNISAISWQPVLVVEEAEHPERTIDHGQATGKLYHPERTTDHGQFKQLVNFITCGCESSAPFFVIRHIGDRLA